MRRLNPEAIPEQDRLFHKAVARAAATSPSRTFVTQPRVHEPKSVNLNQSPRRHRLI
jgi:hypothetical protein